MKRMFSLALVALSGFLSAQTLQITRPDGAVTWSIGQSEAINWSSSGLAGSVKLILLKDGTRLGNIAHDLAVADHSFTWSVGSYGSGQVAAAGSGYQIRIAQQDREDGLTHTTPPFSLSLQPTASLAVNPTVRGSRPPVSPASSDIRVVFPNGGETLYEGNEYPIEWSAPDSFGMPRVLFKKAGRVVKTIEPNRVFAVKTGSTWKLSWIVGAEFASANDYYIRLEKADRSQGDDSDHLFSIASGAPYIVYQGPRDRELTIGRHATVTWRSGHLRPQDKLTIYLFKGNIGVAIAFYVPSGDHSFNWHIGDLAVPGKEDLITPGADYYFSIVCDTCSFSSTTHTRSPTFKLVRSD